MGHEAVVEDEGGFIEQAHAPLVKPDPARIVNNLHLRAQDERHAPMRTRNGSVGKVDRDVTLTQSLAPTVPQHSAQLLDRLLLLAIDGKGPAKLGFDFERAFQILLALGDDGALRRDVVQVRLPPRAVLGLHLAELHAVVLAATRKGRSRKLRLDAP